MDLLRPFRAALAVLCLTQAAIGGSPARADTISNVAQAHWSREGSSYRTNSNKVDLNVVSQVASIETFAASPSGAATLQYAGVLCGESSGAQKSLEVAEPRTARVDRADTLQVGDILYFRIAAGLANSDPQRLDRLPLVIASSQGDREEITVVETAANSGEFAGAIQTSSQPWQPVRNDCLLSVIKGDKVSVEVTNDSQTVPLVSVTIDMLADPYGMVFDSADGRPVSGARVTLIDERTGAPAEVFADDGVTPWPASVIAGQPVTDGAGRSYAMTPGEFRFPLARLGTYLITVDPPAPYAAPSSADRSGLASLRRPDGKAFTITPGSFGQPFSLKDKGAIRVDLPVDRPLAPVSISKQASRAKASPGDAVLYSVTLRNQDSGAIRRGVLLTDKPSQWLRLDPRSVRIDGAPVADQVRLGSDGQSFEIAIGDIAPGMSRQVAYVMTLRADAPPGPAENSAIARDALGAQAVAGAIVEIERDSLASRMTLIGRVTAGNCGDNSQAKGLPGVRLVMEDGSFAITDAEGRYHFEGVVPGTHVVQAQFTTLPEGARFIACGLSTAHAGNPGSRFVSGQGGSLARADFHVAMLAEALAAPAAPGRPKPVDDRVAAGADIDWLAIGDGPTDFLFPTIDHNPRVPAIRVAIRHRVDQTVALRVGGKPADPLAFEGVLTAPGGLYAVSLWRGVMLAGDNTLLEAEVRSGKGKLVAELKREVHYSATPAVARFVPEFSRLIADGHTRPVIAVRILDRQNRPVHDGVSGDFVLGQPYESAAANDAMQTRALTGLGKDKPLWIVSGDEGLAFIELAPTMVSGKLHLTFEFGSNEQRRRQEIETWVVPGNQPWTLVGLAEGSVGARDVAANMERTGRFDSDLGSHARVAFYAKGKVLGRYLLTMAYDSAKQRDDQRLLGAIDPNAYYTVFADGSERRFDAASREKLYLRIESATFYALYGDFNTGLDQTELARYQRVATGIKAEANFGGLHVQGFAAKIAFAHQRDEIQGQGISGPYRLANRAIIANSETVVIETRDRFRSEVVVDSRVLTRFVDYDIDLLAGTIRFREPILSRDSAFNPQMIVIDYEIDQFARGGKLNGALRADWTSPGKSIRVGMTAITDTGNGGEDQVRTNLGAVDLRFKLDEQSEIRAEFAASRGKGETSIGWLVEAERHDGRLDVLAYMRSADKDFGLGQLNAAERGRTKVGIDARYAITERLSVALSGWHDKGQEGGTSRNALELSAQMRTRSTDARIGLHYMEDHLQGGESVRSVLLDAGVTQRFFDNRLEVSADTSLALGKAGAIDLPQRQRLSARLSVLRDVKLFASYEMAKGEEINARTFRAGFEAAPWHGAKVTGGIGSQSLDELGRRSFALFGLAQTFEVTPEFSIDATIDGNRTIGGIQASRVINSDHPVANAAMPGDGANLTEDFTAVMLGASWRRDRWSSTLRGEWRNGDLSRRRGVIVGVIRQLGEGSMVGTGLTWTRAVAKDGAMSQVMDGAIAVAHRPDDAPVSFLAKLEYRSDQVKQAIAGEAGTAGRTALTGSGDLRSRRAIGSISANWTPLRRSGEMAVERAEIGVFAALRQTMDSFEGYDLAGTSLLGGLDAKIAVADNIEIGAVATVRHFVGRGQTSFSFGPQVGFVPAKDIVLTIGYNLSGFKDRDFSASRQTDKGVFAAIRLKLDRDTFGFLGLGRTQ